MSDRIEDLLPSVQIAAADFLNRLTASGVPFVVTSTMRTEGEQRALFAQGRMDTRDVNELRHAAGMPPLSDKENRYTVTNCDGVKKKSNHQSGRALDVVPEEKGRAVWPPASDPRWGKIAICGQAAGFSWGGRWKSFPDLPHYEMEI